MTKVPNVVHGSRERVQFTEETDRVNRIEQAKEVNIHVDRKCPFKREALGPTLLPGIVK